MYTNIRSIPQLSGVNLPDKDLTTDTSPTTSPVWSTKRRDKTKQGKPHVSTPRSSSEETEERSVRKARQPQRCSELVLAQTGKLKQIDQPRKESNIFIRSLVLCYAATPETRLVGRGETGRKASSARSTSNKGQNKNRGTLTSFTTISNKHANFGMYAKRRFEGGGAI